MRFSDTTINRIREHTEGVIGHYVELKRGKGLCPFHSEKHPSLSVRPHSFHCFGCGEKGDVFTFIQKVEGVEFVESVCIAARSAGIPIDEGHCGAAGQADPGPDVQHKHNAAKGLEQWRQSEIQRIGEDLRTRDIIIRQLDVAGQVGTLSETEALISMEYEYRGYSELEFRFDRLIRNEDVLQIWRESRRTA